MAPARVPPRTAAAELSRRDPVLRGLVEHHGPPRLGRPPAVGERFEALARAICAQQLAGRAAQAIWARVEAAVPGPVTPERVLHTGTEALRTAGLSGAKAAAVLDLAQRVVTGEVPLERLGRLPDQEVVARLVVVRGVGEWTAQMFLLFSLRRPDVWPTGDLGVRKGYATAYGLDGLPAPDELAQLGERFAPYRSMAAWYLWRATESLPPRPGGAPERT